jgi:hypothetical protein
LTFLLGPSDYLLGLVEHELLRTLVAASIAKASCNAATLHGDSKRGGTTAMDNKFSPSNEPMEGADDATFRGPTSSTTRRELLKGGAGLAASLSAVSAALTTPAIARDPISLPKAPNIIVLMTDQERHHMHWPAGWAEKTCPGCNG